MSFRVNKPFIEIDAGLHEPLTGSRKQKAIDGHGRSCPMSSVMAAMFTIFVAYLLVECKIFGWLGLTLNLEEFNMRANLVGWYVLILVQVILVRCCNVIDLKYHEDPRHCKDIRCADISVLVDKVYYNLCVLWSFAIWAYFNAAIFIQAWSIDSSTMYLTFRGIPVILVSCCIVVGILFWSITTHRLAPKIKNDFKELQKRLASETSPIGIRPSSKNSLICHWMYWSLGLLVAIMFLGAALPEVISDVTSNSFLGLVKISVGVLVVFRKVRKMEMQTMEGNKDAVAAGLTDVKWMMYTKPCAICQVAMVCWLTADLMDKHDDAKVLPFCNALAILIMSTTLLVWCNLSITILRGWQNYDTFFWTVRKRGIRGNRPVDMHVAQIYLQSVYPSRLWDRFGLDERMSRRLDHHCCLEWAATNGFRFFTIPELMKEERELFEAPAVNDIDTYTKIMIFAVKTMTVEAGRLDPLFIKDVKRPFVKQSIDTWKAPVAGLEIATWDEQYSKREDAPWYSLKKTKRTESSSTFQWQLKLLHWLFPAVEDPRWFKNELEGVLTYEAVVAPFAAMSNTVWKDLTTDRGIELMVFNGIGQFLLRGRSSKTHKVLVQKGKLPKDVEDVTEYLIDYSWIGEYDVRPTHAKYGFIACFDREQRLTYIYVHHWNDKQDSFRSDGWLKRPEPKETFQPSHCSQTHIEQRTRYWEHAKFVMKASLGCGITINDHLLCAHWIVANTASTAARTHLEYHHPIRRLMHIFMLRTPSINYASTLTLLPENRFVHRAAGFTYPEMARCINESAQFFEFKTFPDVVKESGLGSLEKELPWAKDGLRLWDVIHEFVSVVVAMYYASDKEVVEDLEIVAFWHTVSTSPKGPIEERNGLDCAAGFGYKLPELGEGKGALANLINYLSHVIFWVTGNHEYYGALAEYFTTPMGLSTKIWDEEDQSNGLDEYGQVMSDIETYMQDLCVVSATGYPQPRLVSEWAFLMTLEEHGDSKKVSERVALRNSTKVEDLHLAQETEMATKYVEVLDKLKNKPNYDEISPDLAMDYNIRTVRVSIPWKLPDSFGSFVGWPFKLFVLSESDDYQVKEGHLDEFDARATGSKSIDFLRTQSKKGRTSGDRPDAAHYVVDPEVKGVEVTRSGTCWEQLQRLWKEPPSDVYFEVDEWSDTEFRRIEDVEQSLARETNTSVEVLVGPVYKPREVHLIGFYKIIIIPTRRAVAGVFFDRRGALTPIGGLPGVTSEEDNSPDRVDIQDIFYLDKTKYPEAPDWRNFDRHESSELNSRLQGREESDIVREGKLLRRVHKAFMENLRRLDWDITQDNKDRLHPFESFTPMNLECSVNI